MKRVLAIILSLMLLLIDLLNVLFSNFKWIAKATEFMSITSRYADFALGLIYYDNIFFFLSLQALFLFLTVRVLDKRRWN